jgi:branched-subunit amino acid ABC-type transport system permease component
MIWFRIAALLIAVLASGCARVTDSEQVRLCRLLLPVLHAEGAEIREIRVTAATLGRSGVRIEYAVREGPAGRESGAARRAHALTCGFGGTTFEADRFDLVAAATDAGPISDVRLTFLKRYLAEAGRDVVPTALPQAVEIPAAAAYGLQQLVNAIALAAIYALLATAYSLIYGLVGRINLAFGEVAVLGAYGAIGGVAAAVALGIGDPIAGLVLALGVAAAVSGGWSMMIGRVVIAPLHARHRLGQPILIATAAVALSISEFVRVTQGSRERWAPPVFNQPIALVRADDFIVTVTPMQMVVALLGLTAAGGVLWLLARTRFGRSWRAFADDPGTAALFGVDGRRLLAGTFLLAGLLAGLAGWIVAAYYGNVSHSMGAMLGLKALVAAVIGGIGSVPGAFLGGVCVALIEAAWSAYFDITARDIVVFSLLIVVFVLRPGGLLGFAGPKPRDV